jgi:hypothetical protein
MAGTKTFLTIILVLIAAAATIWMAFKMTEIGAPVGMAIAGPVLLALALGIYWMGRRK